MSSPKEVSLTKKQVKFIMEASGEETPKKAFRMFLSAMRKEDIKPEKMPKLINKMMAKAKAKGEK